MPPAPPDTPARFAMLIAALCRVVAAYIAADRNAGNWIIRVCNHLQRIGRHVERLAAQARAGTVPKLRAGWKLTKPRKPATRPPIVLAGKPGWLIHRIIQVAPYGETLRRLLADPEMAALLATAPSSRGSYARYAGRWACHRRRARSSHPRKCQCSSIRHRPNPRPPSRQRWRQRLRRPAVHAVPVPAPGPSRMCPSALAMR